MIRVPVDSAEARELREIEAVEQLDARRERERRRDDEMRHETRCTDGWLGEDLEGRPVPCPVCKQHLLDRPCATCGRRSSGCVAQTALLRGPCCAHCHHDARSSH